MNYDWYFSLKFYKLEFFAFNTKVPEMELFASNYFTAAKKLNPVGSNMLITG